MSENNHYHQLHLALQNIQDSIETRMGRVDSRLDKMWHELNHLSGHKDKMEAIEKRVEVLEKRVNYGNEVIKILEHDQKKREDMKKTFMNPIINRVIVFVLVIFSGMIGATWNNIQQKSPIDVNQISHN